MGWTGCIPEVGSDGQRRFPDVRMGSSSIAMPIFDLPALTLIWVNKDDGVVDFDL